MTRHYRVRIEEITTTEVTKVTRNYEKLWDDEALKEMHRQDRIKGADKLTPQYGYVEVERTLQEKTERLLLDATVDELEVEQVVAAVFDLDECDLRMT